MLKKKRKEKVGFPFLFSICHLCGCLQISVTSESVLTAKLSVCGSVWRHRWCDPTACVSCQDWPDAGREVLVLVLVLVDWPLENSADRKVLHFVTLLIFLWQISLNTDFCSEWNLTGSVVSGLIFVVFLFFGCVCVCVCVYVCVWCSLSERCWFRVCVCVYTGHWRRCYRAAAVLSLVSAEWCLWVAWPARWWVGTGAEPLVLHGGGAVLVRAAAAQGLTMPLAAVLLLSAATLVSKDRGHFFLSLWALSLLVVLCHFFLCGLCHLLVVLVTSFFVGFVFACRPGHFFLCALCLLLVVLVTSFFVGFVLALNQIYSFVVIIGSTNKYRKHKSNRCLFECYL